MTFAPERVTKDKDKQFGLTKEPFYQKFNRLYQDHEKKIKTRRIMKERRDQEDRKKHNFATSRESNRRSSCKNSASADRTRSQRRSQARSSEEFYRRNLKTVSFIYSNSMRFIMSY